jgi:hypothetical protein
VETGSAHHSNLTAFTKQNQQNSIQSPVSLLLFCCAPAIHSLANALPSLYEQMTQPVRPLAFCRVRGLSIVCLSELTYTHHSSHPLEGSATTTMCPYRAARAARPAGAPSITCKPLICFFVQSKRTNPFSNRRWQLVASRSDFKLDWCGGDGTECDWDCAVDVWCGGDHVYIYRGGGTVHGVSRRTRGGAGQVQDQSMA